MTTHIIRIYIALNLIILTNAIQLTEHLTKDVNTFDPNRYQKYNKNS